MRIPRFARHLLVASVSLCLALGALNLRPARPVAAAAFLVNSTADQLDANPGDGTCATASNTCTLRAAIQEANALPGDDQIDIQVFGTITLVGALGDDANLSGDLDVTGNGQITLTGLGSGATIISGGNGDRVFHVLAGGSLTLTSLSVVSGSSDQGGGILNAGSLSLNAVTVASNAASGPGGGLANAGGSATLSATTLTSNTAATGGGIAVSGGSVTISRSLLVGNAASSLGGGAALTGGALDATNVTFRANTSNGEGGAIGNSAVLDLINVTVSENLASGAGSGLRNTGTGRILNVIVANNGGGKDCDGTLESRGNNFIQSPGGCTLSGDVAGNQSGTNPLAGFNGQLYTLAVGSPAIDGGRNAGCPVIDQAGNSRPQDGNGDGNAVCDMGAYEAPGVPVSATATPTSPVPPTATSPGLPTPLPSATSPGLPAPIPSDTPAPTGPAPPGATQLPGAGGAPAGNRPASVKAVGSAGGTFTCGRWTVTIPPGAVPDGSGIECGDFDPGVAPQTAPAGSLLKRTMAINIWGPSNAFITTFSGRVPTACYAYTSDDLRQANGRADRLGVVNAEVKGAYRVLRSTVNTATRQVCVAVVSTGLFDVVAGGVSASGPAPVTNLGGDYVVRRGDTLFLIGLRFRITVAALRLANGLVGDRIYPGQRLTIPNFSGSVPAPAVTPVASVPVAPVPTSGQSYRVQRGDTLYTIAVRFGTSVGALQAANGISGSRILAGHSLIIPTGASGSAPVATPAPNPVAPTPAPTPAAAAGVTRTHTVQRGDNLFRIGLRYGTTAAAIRAANGLNGNLIYVGQTLVIP